MILDTASLRKAQVGREMLIDEIAREADVAPCTVRRVLRSGKCSFRVGRAMSRALGLELREVIVDYGQEPSTQNSGV